MAAGFRTFHTDSWWILLYLSFLFYPQPVIFLRFSPLNLLRGCNFNGLSLFIPFLEPQRGRISPKMGPALTTGCCCGSSGLHWEINRLEAISSTRNKQPLRFEVFYKFVVLIINLCFRLPVSISCICAFCTTWEKKGCSCGREKCNCSLLWKPRAASQHSLNLGGSAPSSFYSLFSGTPHFSILRTFISIGATQNEKTH